MREIEDTLDNDRCARHGAQQQQGGTGPAARECEEKASQCLDSIDAFQTSKRHLLPQYRIRIPPESRRFVIIAYHFRGSVQS
jgi:hypothetical protein